MESEVNRETSIRNSPETPPILARLDGCDDHSSQKRPALIFHHEPKAEVGRRHARGAATCAGIPDEIGHVGSVRALHDANAAIGAFIMAVAGLASCAALIAVFEIVAANSRRQRKRAGRSQS